MTKKQIKFIRMGNILGQKYFQPIKRQAHASTQKAQLNTVQVYVVVVLVRNSFFCQVPNI